MQCRRLGEVWGACPVVSGETDGPAVLWKRGSSLCLREPQDSIAPEALNLEIFVTPCRRGSVLSTKSQKGLPWFPPAEPSGQDRSCGWHFLPASSHPRASDSWGHRHLRWGGTPPPQSVGDKRAHLGGGCPLTHRHFRWGGAPPPQSRGDYRAHLGGGCPLTHFLCRRQGRDWRRCRTQAA